MQPAAAPQVVLQVPASFAIAFGLIFLALLVVAVVALLTIAVRSGAVLEAVRRDREDNRALDLRVRGLEGWRDAVERRLPSSPLRVAGSTSE